MLVAIDTSTDIASLALVQEGEILAELSWLCRESHTTQLLPNLSHLLNQTKVSLQSAESIIVAIGPGSYNGLRVGVSTAKGLAFSLCVPLIGIGTMEVQAYVHAETVLPVCPLFSAGRGEIAMATYQNQDGQWLQLVSEHIVTLEELCTSITTQTLFCGEYLPTIKDELKKRLGDKAVIPSLASNLRRAAYLAELGMKRFKAGDFDDVATLQPLYLRRPMITEPKHK